jgi:hypothetical protein
MKSHPAFAFPPAYFSTFTPILDAYGKPIGRVDMAQAFSRGVMFLLFYEVNTIDIFPRHD